MYIPGEWFYYLACQCKFQALFYGRYTARILIFELSFEIQCLKNFHFESKIVKYMKLKLNLVVKNCQWQKCLEFCLPANWSVNYFNF